jgi:hypothetical protein
MQRCYTRLARICGHLTGQPVYSTVSPQQTTATTNEKSTFQTTLFSAELFSSLFFVRILKFKRKKSQFDQQSTEYFPLIFSNELTNLWQVSRTC